GSAGRAQQQGGAGYPAPPHRAADAPGRDRNAELVIETACRRVLSLLLAGLLLAAMPQARAEPAPYAPLEDALDGPTLGPLMGLLDTASLARGAGLAAQPVPEALLRRFGSQRIQGHRLYEQPDSDQLLLRLDLAPQGLNWLALIYHAQSPKPVRDWYD